MNRSARDILLLICITVAVMVVGVGGIAAIVWYAVPGVNADEAFAQTYSMRVSDFYLWQPGKSKAFLGGCLVTPIFLAAGYLLGCLALRAQIKSTEFLFKGCVGLLALIFLCSIVPMFYCPLPPLPGVAPNWFFFLWYFRARPFSIIAAIFSFLVVGILCFFLARQRAHRRIQNRTLLGLCVLWALLIPLRFYIPSKIFDDPRFNYHFNSVSDALSQVANGRHFLIDFPHIYGGYVEFLGPLLAHLPRSVESFLIPLPVLGNLAVLALLFIARLTIRQPLLLFVTGLSVLGLEYMLTDSDRYYQYFTIRMLFPAFGLLGAAVYLRRSDRWCYALVTVWAALATLWNFETGIVLWVSWVVTLAVRRLVPFNFSSLWRQIAIQLGALTAAWLIFLTYLRLVSGEWPRLELLFPFQKLLVTTGYFCIRIIVPDLWVVVLLIYAIALGSCMVFQLQRFATWRTYFCFMLSLTGVGLFSYFVGRSAESNLATVSYVLVLLIGLLLSETKRLISNRRLPSLTWWLHAPAMIILAWLMCLTTAALPGLLGESAEDVLEWQQRLPSLVDINANFIRQQTSPLDRVYFLSNQSGFYYYLSETTNPLRIPGPVELIWTRDMDILVAAINAGAIPKLFVDDNFFIVPVYKYEVYTRLREVIARRYFLSATSPTHKLALYLPR